MKAKIDIFTPKSIKNGAKNDDFRVFVNETADQIEIMLYGTIGDAYDQADAATVTRMLSANKNKPVTMRVNSFGGLAFDGLAIYNALADHSGPTVGIIESVAASAASLAVLDYAVKYREDLLYNRYQAGRNTIAKYTANPPYAYLVPQNQRDPGTAVELLRRLAFNGIRVSQLERDVRYENTTFPRGTWVIPMDQEFGELARQVLEKQEYPDLREFPGGPPEQPYDAAGWTLPYQMDVKVLEARSPLGAVLTCMPQPSS